MEFNLKKSQIYKAVRFYGFLKFGSLRFWRILFLTICFSTLGLYTTKNLASTVSPVLVNRIWVEFPDVAILLGWTYISSALGFSALFIEIFFNYHLKNPEVGQGEQNLAEFLDFDSAVILKQAGAISYQLKEAAISTNSLLLAIVNYAPADHVFMRLGIASSQLQKQLKQVFNFRWTIKTLPLFDMSTPSQELLDLLSDANDLRLKHVDLSSSATTAINTRITQLDLLTSLFDYNPTFKQIMIDVNLDKNDLASLSTWYESESELLRKKKMFWRLENLIRQPPVGIGWTYGYSWYLSHYAIDITRQFQERKLEIKLIGRQKVVDQMEQVLERSEQSNVLLVGDPGVGKRTAILGLTQMIYQGKALPALNYKKVFELNVPLIASSSKEITEVQNTIISVLNESAKAGNVILVIEDFHNFIGALSGMGRVDISQLLLPYLESANIKIIATTDLVNFHKFIESRAEITKVFEKVGIEESTPAETLRIVEELVPAIERHFGVLITYGAIKNIIDAAGRYIMTTPFPEKAIDLLTEVVSHVKSLKKTVVLPENVNEVITLKTQIPVGETTSSEKNKLINLEAEMHKSIIGQEEAVSAIAQTMQRLRAGLTRRGKPAGVFLFVGPTGVGKTLAAKILARTYFGSQNKVLRFDMSEYQDAESIDRFLGSLRTGEPGQLASKVRDEPFSVILLDEIEKAHKNILNIFLAVFDEGQMTDVFGRKVNFEQSIIIATSNAAANLIREMVNQKLDPSTQKEKVIEALVSEHYFSPELLNRFDEVVVFHSLNQEQLVKIAGLLIDGLIERLRQQGYIFKSTHEITEYISRVGFDPQFGARPMQRAIQDKLETVIARKILEGKITKGQEFNLILDEIML